MLYLIIIIIIIIIIVNIFNIVNSVIRVCTVNNKCKIAATLYALEKWFVSGI